MIYTRDQLRSSSLDGSLISVMERALSTDEFSVMTGCCMKRCAAVQAETDGGGKSGLRAGSRVGWQLTAWAQQGTETLTALAAGCGTLCGSPGHGRRTRQNRLPCLYDEEEAEPVWMESPSSVRSHTPLLPAQRLEELMTELFHLQDLNGNGVLEETELIKLNEKIAMLHYGKNIDRQAVKDKYSDLFRTQLSADGEPVTYTAFRAYMLPVLKKLDSDLPSQEMILEGFIGEAREGREAFRLNSLASASDAPWLPAVFH